MNVLLKGTKLEVIKKDKSINCSLHLHMQSVMICNRNIHVQCKGPLSQAWFIIKVVGYQYNSCTKLDLNLDFRHFSKIHKIRGEFQMTQTSFNFHYPSISYGLRALV